MLEFLRSQVFIQAIISAFFAILFLQSGLDKVIDYKGNLAWLQGHFAKSPLKSFVPLLLITITIFEVAAGGFSLIGTATLLFQQNSTLAYYGALLAAVSLVMLFFGQRMAKDYAGAGGLVPYFIVAIAALVLLK